MNDLCINTKKNENGINSISNVYSFTSISGNTNNNFTSSSTNYADKKIESGIKNKTISFYTINLDWKGTNSGHLVLKWNGRNDSGQQVAPGIYLCKLNGQTKQLIYEGVIGNK